LKTRIVFLTFALVAVTSLAGATDWVHYYSNGQQVGWTRYDCYGGSYSTGQQTSTELVRHIPCFGEIEESCPAGLMMRLVDFTGPVCVSTNFLADATCGRADLDFGICIDYCPPNSENTPEWNCLN